MKLIFGIVYLISTIIFTLHFYLNTFSLVVSILLSLYLIGKGIFSTFAKNSPLSALDSAAGLYFLLLSASVFPNNIVTVIFLLYLAQKGASYFFQGLH